MSFFLREISALSVAFIELKTPRLLAAGGAAASLCAGLSLLKAKSRGSFRQGLRVNYFGNSLVMMPLDRWSTITKKGLGVAVQLKGQLRIIHVEEDGTREEFQSLWQQNVVKPLVDANRTVPELVLLPPRSGQVLQPVAEYILRTERLEPDRQIFVIIPQIVVRHWWERPLHNHRSNLLKLILAAFGGQRITMIDVPWHL